MANELRARDGMLAGTLDIDHTSGATTLTAAILAAHRAIGSTMHSAWIISDPHQGLLARNSYAPGTPASYTTTGTSQLLDATNMAVTFVAPRSGKVRITLHGLVGCSDAATSMAWCLLDTSNALISGSTREILNSDGGTLLFTAEVALTGLTPGTSYTYRWGQTKLTGSGSVTTLAGSNYPATMQVFDSGPDASADSEIVYVTAHTASAGTATIARGQEGTTAQAWKAGSRIAHGPTLRDLALGRLKLAKQVSGTQPAFTSTSAWTTANSALDLTLPVYAGDVIEYGINGLWNDDAAGGRLDVATVVSGSVVNYFANNGSSTNDGIAAWYGQPSGGNTGYVGISGSVLYVVQAADIAAGSIVLRLVGRLQPGGGSTKTLLANADDPLFVWARNLGPQEA